MITPYQDEVLTILTEECGETIQEICKIKRFGLSNHSHHVEGKTHLECLTQELGDLLAMIQMIKESNIGITDEGLAICKQKKLDKVVKWMTHKNQLIQF
jgi:NTP pyrophosphatase (non-canonical NTP hydrolase)